MKVGFGALILEPREAMLSNHEVLAHVQDVKRRYREEINEQGPAAAMKPGNLETVMKELVDYLSSTVAGSQSPTTISNLVEALVKYQFEKIEVLMVLNHLPKNETELDVLVEELESRLSDEEITQVLDTIRSTHASRIETETAE
ncbi:DNA-directed RNA polymerase III subunit rpc9 [Drechslerella dactyloides]|uniref:DNA-directed RNA polymerase III subunit RPC9 n=1 Tax=Drechslerella dactyloides TaxID=74499 RepID=A0AAD6IVF3_DREDA|nr:DNA-directed RNA polymerase III subunit rpc9 [Drechslerella dactyloides]